jgi:hypothetical protein
MSIKLKTYTGEQNLCEIFQSIDVKFAFVNSNYEEVSKPAKCRDFLGDCIWSYKTKKNVQIYGFNYSYKDSPYDLETLRLSLTFPDFDTMKIFKSRWKEIISKKEKKALGLTRKTEVLETDQKLTLIVEADKLWQSNTWKLSLYTFYLKLACYKTLEEVQDPENRYIKILTKEKENRLLNNTNYNEEDLFDEIYEQHNQTGFVSIIKQQAKPNLNLLMAEL